MKVLVLIATLIVAVTAEKVKDGDCPLRCQLPMREGHCDKPIEQFYFDNEAKECKSFTYKGCSGNVNRFKTQQLCEKTCLKACQSSGTTTTTKPPTGEKPLPVRCTLKLKPGDCNKFIPRFYFDTNTRECKSFNYSGCGGNVNNFRSEELCEQVCLGA